MSQQIRDKGNVLLAPGREFCHGQVVDFQAQAATITGVRIPHRDQAILPARRQNRRVFRHAVGVITEGLMKWRTFANGAVNQVGITRVAKGEHVRFDGNQKIGGRVRELAQQGLAANDNDFGRSGDTGSGANDVFKLRSLHGGDVF